MAKSKYDENTFPLLAEKNAREGMIDVENAKALGIRKDTFYRYIKKYEAFSDAIKRGKQPITVKVENKLLERCYGIEYDEVYKEYQKHLITGELTLVKKKITTKFIPPDVTAHALYLNNKARSEYKRDWSKADLQTPPKEPLPAIDDLEDSQIEELYKKKKADGTLGK